MKRQWFLLNKQMTEIANVISELENEYRQNGLEAEAKAVSEVTNKLFAAWVNHRLDVLVDLEPLEP